MLHLITNITAVPASGPGAISGFQYTCSCGDTARYSSEVLTRQFAQSHADYMNSKIGE